VAAVIAVLAVVGGAFYWQSHEQKQTLNEITALVEKYSAVTQAQAAVPGAKQSLTEALTAIAEGAATDPRYAQALALLKAGKPAEAQNLSSTARRRCQLRSLLATTKISLSEQACR
jgi:predicted negative regulator of RcsB-dependent stress response